MDGKLALLYFAIIAMITFSYLDDENVDRVRHAIAAAIVAPSQVVAK